MIELTRLNDSKFYLNPFQLEMVEKKPDTIITLHSGKNVLVKESPEQIKKLFAQFLGGSIGAGIQYSKKLDLGS